MVGPFNAEAISRETLVRRPAGPQRALDFLNDASHVLKDLDSQFSTER